MAKQVGGGGSKSVFEAFVKGSLDKVWGSGLKMIFIIAALVAVVFFVKVSGEPLIAHLAKPGAARGLITLLFAVGTIWIAVVLALAAMSAQCNPEQFGRAKEVLTILVGILGTIIGFYFGAESDRTAALNTPAAVERRIAELKGTLAGMQGAQAGEPEKKAPPAKADENPPGPEAKK